MAQLQKAAFVVHWANRGDETIPVQWNPTEISFDKGAQIAEITIPGLDSPLLQFVRGQNEKLTVDLFFDSTEDGMGQDARPVTALTDRFYQLIKIEPERHAPPICTFVWNETLPGSQLGWSVGNQRRNGFTCIVENIKQKLTLWSPAGVPLRSTLSLTLREYKPLERQLAELNLSSPDRTLGWVVAEGETLSGIAGRHYPSPGDWRRIARHNGIEDPRRLKAGTFLELPPLP